MILSFRGDSSLLGDSSFRGDGDIDLSGDSLPSDLGRQNHAFIDGVFILGEGLKHGLIACTPFTLVDLKGEASLLGLLGRQAPASGDA